MLKNCLFTSSKNQKKIELKKNTVLLFLEIQARKKSKKALLNIQRRELTDHQLLASKKIVATRPHIF